MPLFRLFCFSRKKLSRHLYAFLSVCCSLLYNLSFAQHREIDSLNKLLPSLHAEARVNCLNELTKSYSNSYTLPYFNSNTMSKRYGRTDSAEIYANEAYLEARALNYKFGIANAVSNLAGINAARYNFVIAQNYAEKAISLFKETNDEALLNRAYVTLAGILWNEGEITREQNNNLELALQYYKKVKDTSRESFVLVLLSDCHIWKGNFEKGYEYLQDQINLVKNSSRPEDILVALEQRQELYDIGGWNDSVAAYSTRIIAYKEKMGIDTSQGKAFQYFKQQKWDSAEYYYKQVHILIESNNGLDSFLKNKWVLRNDIDIASIEQREGKYEEALPVFLKALQYNKERNFVRGELEVLLNISQVYQLEGKNNDAIHYGQDLLSLAQKAEANYYILNACKLLWEIYDKKKDSATAYKYYLKYTGVKDSTINGTYQRKLAVINELTNEREQQDQITALGKDNKLKEADIQKNVLIRNILLAGVFILILLGFIIYTVISLKRKNEKLEKIGLQYSMDMERIENEKKQSILQNKATELEMQALRAQMNPHFIFNCLSSINRFILKNKMEDASDYLTKFSRLIRMVLNNSKRAFISLEDELETLRLYLDMERLRFKDSFDYSFTYNNSVETANVFIPPLLLQPFAENAIWHGLMHRKDGFLSFNFTAGENFLTCIISDNGIGRKKAEMLKSKSAEKQKSMGLKITTERLSLLNNNSIEQTAFAIEDITDEDGNGLGTRVNLKIFYKEMIEA
ncbi:MAG: histidine kinase [Chitinophagales bacterium]